MQINNFLRPLIATTIILIIPLALTIRDGGVEGVGWNWGIADFIIMGLLIFTTGFLIEFVNKRIKNKNLKLALILGILLALFLTWLELAVDGVSHIFNLIGN